MSVRRQRETLFYLAVFLAVVLRIVVYKSNINMGFERLFDPRQRTIFSKLQPLGVDRQVRRAVLTSTTDRVYLLVETGVWP